MMQYDVGHRDIIMCNLAVCCAVQKKWRRCLSLNADTALIAYTTLTHSLTPFLRLIRLLCVCVCVCVAGEGFTGTLREGKEVLVKVQSEDASWVANRLGNIGITGTYLLLCFVRYRTIIRTYIHPNIIQSALAACRIEGGGAAEQ